MNAEAEMTAAIVAAVYSVQGRQFAGRGAGIEIEQGGPENFFKDDAILINRKIRVLRTDEVAAV